MTASLRAVTAVGGLIVVLSARPARGGDLLVDGGLVVGTPAALPTGLSTGIGAGVTHIGTLAWGARASWSSATEYTSWTVAHSDLRLRATGVLQHRAGRGSFGLRLGLGPTLVHETRVNPQGARAGLTGTELQTSAWRVMPAADLEATISLQIAGSWFLVVDAGPSVHLLDGVHAGWLGSLGVAWQS